MIDFSALALMTSAIEANQTFHTIFLGFLNWTAWIAFGQLMSVCFLSIAHNTHLKSAYTIFMPTHLIH